MRSFKDLRKALGRAVLFFLILILLFALLSVWIIEEVKENDGLIQNRYKSIIRIQAEKENSLDVLVLGDSLSYTSFSPMQLWSQQGIPSYICGQSGQKIQETYNMLETALNTQTPKLVILETNTLFREQKGLEALKDVVLKKGNYLQLFFGFHDIWKSKILGTENTSKCYKGFTPNNAVQAWTGGNYMAEAKSQTAIPKMVSYYMEKIIALCRENNVELLLVSAPSPANYNIQKHNALNQYALEKGIKYLDFNVLIEDAGIDWEMDTMDQGDHLNLAGACKVTDYMGRYLKENYDFPDRRKDAGYGKWNEEVKEYETDIETKLEGMADGLSVADLYPSLCSAV